MKYNYKIFSLLLLFNLVLNFPLLAQHDKPRTISWYSSNDRGNYFEGLYTSEIGNFAVEPLSFYAYYEPFSPNSNDEALNVLFYLPEEGMYFLKAEELFPFLYYWMEDKKRDGNQGWNIFKDWRTNNYLRKLDISQKNLGILVRTGSYNSSTFTPAHIFHSNLEDKVSKYVATLRINSSISKGVCKVYSGFHHQIHSNKAPLVIKHIGRKLGGTPITIIFEDVISNKPAGWFTVELIFDALNSSDTIRYPFSFYHQPKLNWSDQYISK